jgi:type I restriction enzyme M protein
MPGRYVGAEEIEDDGVLFEDKMNALTAKLAQQFTKGAELEKTIREKLMGIGYEF